MCKKRSCSIPTVGQVHIPEFIRSPGRERAMSCPNEKGFGESLLRVEMPPPIAHLPEDDIESPDGHSPGIPGGGQSFEELWADPIIFDRIHVKSERRKCGFQFRVCFEFARKIQGQ